MLEHGPLDKHPPGPLAGTISDGENQNIYLLIESAMYWIHWFCQSLKFKKSFSNAIHV